MSEPISAPESSKIFRAAIWVAIGALIAAAIVCVIWVLIGDSNGIVGRAFLTILLLAAFAGVAILESNLADRRPAWFALASMVSWVLALLVGAFLIWMPESPDDYGVGAERFFKFLLILLILQGALLHIRLFSKAYARHQTTFTSVVAYVTMGLVVILAVMLVLPLMLEEFFDFRDIYWRVVVALAILVAVGTALVPLVNALFAPKKPRRPATAAAAYDRSAYGAQQAAPPQLQAWPTYGDGRTPLPVLPDGSPDWNAYYTGWPTYPQQPYAAAAPAEALPEETAPSARPSSASAQPASPAAHDAPIWPPAPDQPVPPAQPTAPPAPGRPDAPTAPPQQPAPPVPGHPDVPPAPPLPGHPEMPPAPPVPPQQ
ncbi:hypothetical protein AB3M83_04490 [Microbacterium sp. 179-B 1A2 NHS]|uniref:hypothetical protein n=1 Tax=Microbacterium sp. 179-B 1A2 NHS TaxID=3142383 RepID=UPI00399F6A8E